MKFLISLCAAAAVGALSLRLFSRKGEESTASKAVFNIAQAPRFESFYLGYYKPDKEKCDIEKLRDGMKIVSQAKLYAASVESLSSVEFHDGKGSLGYYYMKDMDDSGLGALVDYFTRLPELVQKLNRIITAKKLPLELLSTSQIISRDSELTKTRRAVGKSVIASDINTVHDILSEQGYVLVQILGEGLQLCLTILTESETAELRELELRA